MKKRIVGIDVARALAVFGMIIVNFKIVFGDTGPSWIKSVVNIFNGKAAATFVTLAGLGIALMTNSAIRNNDLEKLKIVQKRIIKRALFLFIIGISYISIWPADILHFYGIYMAILLLLIKAKENTILLVALALILTYPFLLIFENYENGWNFETLEYLDFWTLKGFFRNLFYNGFHPVIPWTSFLLIGYWFGKQKLHDDKFVRKTMWISSLCFVIIQGISFLLIKLLSEGNIETQKELAQVLGTSPMPPFPIYMFNGIAIALAVISACILFARKYHKSFIVDALNKTGQLALTFYVAHVVIGMGIVESIDPSKMGKYSIEFSFLYSIGFSFACIIFAIIWKKYKQSGPLEWLMRKITN